MSRVCSRHLRTFTSRALLLLLVLLLCMHRVLPVGAVFDRKKEADNGSTEEVESVNNIPEADPARTSAVLTTTATTDFTTEEPPRATTSEPNLPPSIVEAEARTARELSRAVRTLTRDLQSCETRVGAIEEGFQNLYSAHLGSVDGLRKCREGISPTLDDLERLGRSASLEGVIDADLVRRARAKEDQRIRNARDEDLASKHRGLIRKLEKRVESLVRRERSWERTISELQARRDLLEKREGAWERTIGDLMGEIEVRARREAWWEEIKREMEGRIGALSQITVAERFGAGPFYVAMNVLLNEGNPSSQRIVFQLAPIELTPHSVYLFLSQIAEGYWSRGTPAIVLNAEHVLQACPHPCLDGVDLGGILDGYPYEDMRAAGLDTVSFQEYSSLFPHEKYTVGFAGRPHSGPEFFINLMDNTLDHGTIEERKGSMGVAEFKAWMEEASVGLEETFATGKALIEPYPCFGKVVEGFDVVDEIAQELTRASLLRDHDSEDEDKETELELDENLLLRPVKITSMTILENYSLGAAERDKKKNVEEGSKIAFDEL